MRLFVAAVLLLLTTACAASPRGDRPRGSHDLLVVDQMEAGQYGNVYELIRNQRPSWLRTRGTNSLLAEDPIMVYVDGNRMGGPEVLTALSTVNVREVRFFDPSEAQARFGLGNSNGAILITTRRG